MTDVIFDEDENQEHEKEVDELPGKPDNNKENQEDQLIWDANQGGLQ